MKKEKYPKRNSADTLDIRYTSEDRAAFDEMGKEFVDGLNKGDKKG